MQAHTPTRTATQDLGRRSCSGPSSTLPRGRGDGFASREGSARRSGESTLPFTIVALQGKRDERRHGIGIGNRGRRGRAGASVLIQVFKIDSGISCTRLLYTQSPKPRGSRSGGLGATEAEKHGVTVNLICNKVGPEDSGYDDTTLHAQHTRLG